MKVPRYAPVRRAPWGVKRYYVPIPVLAVLLLATAVAAPNVFKVEFTVFEDGKFTIEAKLQQVVRMGSAPGKVLGVLTITSHHPFEIILGLGTVSIVSGTDSDGTFTPDGNIAVTVAPREGNLPLSVPAGGTVNVPFSGPLMGNLAAVTLTTDFLVTPDLMWTEVHEDNGVLGPFTYTEVRVCDDAVAWGMSPSGPGWDAACHAV